MMSAAPSGEGTTGSRWYKTDLQIASPAGGFKLRNTDLQTPAGRTAAAEAYVTHIKQAGIEVFAVTDHNATSMLEDVRSAARAEGLVMFPGMELSTGSGADGVHLLLLGDPEADISLLSSSWMRAADFSKDHPAFDDRNQHLPSHLSMIDILDRLPEETIAIAPHILTQNGVASGDSIRESSLKWRCLHHDRLEAVDVGTPTEAQGFNSKFRERALDNFPAVKRIAYVATSDAYAPIELGRHTWIRMYRPDLPSLRQAFLDYEARIFCDWDTRLSGDPNEVQHAYIRSIKLEHLSTSSDVLEIEFNPRVTVIVGSRGSGKSTVVQGLRSLFGGNTILPESVQQESDRYRNEVFREATITCSFVEALSRATTTATWQHECGTSTEENRSLANVRVVSQKELFERTSGDRPGAQSPSANMLALIDEALDDDQVTAELVASGIDITAVRKDQFTEELRDRRRRFAEIAALRLGTEAKLASRKKVEEDLAEVDRKLAALDDEEEKAKLEAAQALLKDKSAISRYAKKAEGLADALEAVTHPSPPSVTSDEGKRATNPLRLLAAHVSTAVSELVAEIRRVAAATLTSLVDETGEFAQAVGAADAVKANYEEKLAALGVDLSQYEALRVQKSSYIEELSTLDDLVKKQPSQVADEAEAWTEIDELYATRRAAREMFTRIVSSRTPGLRFSINSHADHAGWQQMLHSQLGCRQGDHLESLQRIAEWIWAAGLEPGTRLSRSRIWRDALLRNDYGALSEARLSSSFVSRLKHATEALRIDLATLRADDALDMRFLKQGNDPANEQSWQTVTEGSPGQRSAAMLAFTLSYGDSPLVLDQPEDDLDSALVSELVVTQFRKTRWKRQLIVVTHEANIPVNTDAELVVVLENAEGKLRVMRQADEPIVGPIDHPEVRRSIQELLEGGVRAFVNRERRYDNELSKYRADVLLLARNRLAP